VFGDDWLFVNLGFFGGYFLCVFVFYLVEGFVFDKMFFMGGGLKDINDFF